MIQSEYGNGGVIVTEQGVVKVLKGLNDLKRLGSISNYAIGGGIAFIVYTEPFFTDELDIFLILPLGSVSSAPVTAYFINSGATRSNKKSVITVDGTRVRFIVVLTPLEVEAVRYATKGKILGVWTRVLTPEHLGAIAAKSNRLLDRARVAILLSQARINQPVLDDLLTRHGLKPRYEEITR